MHGGSGEGAPEGVLVADLRHGHESVGHGRPNVGPNDNGDRHVNLEGSSGHHGNHNGGEGGAALHCYCALI